MRITFQKFYIVDGEDFKFDTSASMFLKNESLTPEIAAKAEKALDEIARDIALEARPMTLDEAKEYREEQKEEEE